MIMINVVAALPETEGLLFLYYVQAVIGCHPGQNEMQPKSLLYTFDRVQGEKMFRHAST
jgi:hypothetical protein